MMTLREIAVAEGRANGATPGPWRVSHSYNITCHDGFPPVGVRSNITDYKTRDIINAVFIANARTDVPALCETARRAIELLARSMVYDRSQELMEACELFLAQVTKEP